MEYKIKLKEIISLCVSKIGYFTEEQKTQIANKFINESPRVTMKVITQKLLEKYKDTNSVEFQTLLNEVFKLNDDSFSSAQSIVDEINADRQKEIKENHQIVNESIQEVCKKFNELGIDYYIVGALPVYLTAGKLIRKHEDIDFMVAEKDMPKIAKALSTTIYKLHDDRLDSPRVLDENGNLTCGDHEVVAKRDDNDFHLGFFMFKREKNGSITQKEYHARIDKNGNKVPVLFERLIDKEMFEFNYGRQPVKYLDTEFRCSTPESVYDIKSFMLKTGYRDKDDFDVTTWSQLKKNNSEESLINEEVLKEISKISQRTYIPPTSEDVSPEMIEKIKKQQEEMCIAKQNTNNCVV